MKNEKRKTPALSSADLLALIEHRHVSDVFVRECNDGPSQFTSHSRMDAWAMARSWTKPLTYAYEIKMSRSDFLKDEKWMRYLDYCNLFSFVSPSHVIRAEEVPETAGLLWCSKNGTRLYTKKKAPFREVEIPETLWRYILMARTLVTQEHFGAETAFDFWRRWLQQKADRREIGHRVSRSLGKLVRTKIDEVKVKQRVLEARIEECQEVEALLKDMGMGVGYYWDLKQRFEQRIKMLREGMPEDLNQALRTLRTSLDAFEKALSGKGHS